MLLLALVTGKPLNFNFSFSYIGSLMYLAVFGSIIAFTSYLTLLGKIGADRAAYVMLVFPIVALILSTLFEGYLWDAYAIVGVVLVTLGNFMVLKGKKKNPS